MDIHILFDEEIILATGRMQEQLFTDIIIKTNDIVNDQSGTLESCCPMLETVIETQHIMPLYMQLISLGTIMIIGHCSGMCGPLMLSFRFGLNQKRPVYAASMQLLTYQLGKALVYMSAGALAAILGQSLLAMKNWMAYLCIFIALIILMQALSWWLPWKLSCIPQSWYNSIHGQIRKMQSFSSRYRQLHPTRGNFLLGMSMSLLPCMLPFWVLGLAAGSASPLHGSLLMGLLVLLNTPILLLFAVSPHFMGKIKKHFPIHIAPIALCCSALWMLLIGLASLGYIGHFSFTLGPTHVVFW